MAATTYTLTGNAHDLTGAGALTYLRGWVVALGVDFVNDPTTNEQRYGNKPLTFDSTGAWSVTLIGTGPLVAAYMVVIEYADGTPRSGHKTVSSQPFVLTANTTFGSVVATTVAAVLTAADYAAQALASKNAAAGSASAASASATAAQGYAQQAHDISNIDTSDGVVKTLVTTPTSQTAAALSASYALKDDPITYSLIFGG